MPRRATDNGTSAANGRVLEYDLASLPHLPAIFTEGSPTSNQTELAYQKIRRQIIELELTPGGTFTETKLADQLGVSKTPVREALVRLHHDGLVETIPRAGYLVRPVTLNTTKDLCVFRSIIEPKAAEMAAARSLPAPMLARLGELSEHELAKRYPSDRAGVEKYLRDHFEFQSIIANCCGNDRLAASLVGVLNDLERVLRLSLGDLPWSEGRAGQRIAIVNAIAEGDPTAAYQLTLQRTREAQSEIIEALISSPSLTNASISLGR